MKNIIIVQLYFLVVPLITIRSMSAQNRFTADCKPIGGDKHDMTKSTITLRRYYELNHVSKIY